MEGNSLRVPIFLEGTTKKNLVQKMLDHNRRTGIEHRYFDIQKDGRKWVAWVYKDLTKELKLKDVTNRIAER